MSSDAPARLLTDGKERQRPGQTAADTVLRKTEEEVSADTSSFRQKASEAAAAIPPGIYRHFKGNYYQVLTVAVHSETLEPMVVYRALYGEGGTWVRPAAMWLEEVERDGRICRRFAYVGESLPEKENPE